MLAQVLEAAMMVCFGLSWPTNAYKNYKAATAAGTSWQFIGLITLGYVVGIAAKFIAGMVNWVLVVYFLNLACLGLNWAVYFRNVKLDRARIEDAKRATNEGVGSGTEHHAAQLRRVIIASDGSPSALKAATFAAEAIDMRNTQTVEVLAVAPDESPEAKRQAESAISSTAEVLQGEGVRSEGTVRVGVAAAQIVDAAVQGNADIIVMGSRGLSGLKEVVLGSVSRKVIDNVACPVLVIK